jgi:hypothetical protein
MSFVRRIKHHDTLYLSRPMIPHNHAHVPAPAARYTTALEIGCSIGVFTRLLAPRCQSLLALDVSGLCTGTGTHTLHRRSVQAAHAAAHPGLCVTQPSKAGSQTGEEAPSEGQKDQMNAGAPPGAPHRAWSRGRVSYCCRRARRRTRGAPQGRIIARTGARESALSATPLLRGLFSFHCSKYVHIICPRLAHVSYYGPNWCILVPKTP